ncbi:MAG: molybdopterin-binding oxidoreductase [Sneathiella sp.]|jgi:anaerobic selenocysteine-containing dehydrogenase|uniref:molybdopterin-dependent oxidoreductase n=1 Tax=Sneathiella sp. TaxID=1964365 RepID=UPI000C4D95F7|nr:molybdopterin-dependent oxidoreductase [Sneathiella sp.]MAL78267.1 molybdopterin-binding oxidoreductase [Sneathiella sp.]
MSVELPSVCPLDCPDTCSFTVTVEAGEVRKVRGSTANPLTNGVVCNKVARYYPEFVHGENRLRHPLKRVGPKGGEDFARISWEEAIDTIHHRFSAIIAEYGPQAIMPYNYAGPHGLLAMGSMDLRFFHSLGATLLARRPLCGGVKSEAYKGTFGAAGAMQPLQLEAAKLIVVWGNNVTFSNLHLAPIIKRAKAKGAKLVVIDPKRIKIAEQADMYIAVRPGMDIILAFAIAAELERIGGFNHDFIAQHVQGADEFMAEARKLTIEESSRFCGVPVDDIRKFAALYKDSSPAAISVGNGIERNRNGGNSIRAIFALPALAGKFGLRGGGIVGGAGNLFPKTLDKLQRPDLVPPGTRTLNIIDIGRHLAQQDLDIPLKGLFIYNHNPVVVSPDQNVTKAGLAREDIFTVGCDVAMTDSMKYCDIILPAATHFEHDEIFCAYGQPYLQRAAPVIEPVGESLPNTEIFRRLAARFRFNEDIFKASDKELMDDAIDGTDPRLKGYRPSEIPLGTALSMEKGETDTILFGNAVPATPSGKIELASAYLRDAFGQEIPVYHPVESEYPLSLVTPSSNKMITSTFGGVKANDDTPMLEMHPADAAARGLADGIRVRLFNELGEVFLPLKITENVREGVIYSPKGSWFKTTENNQTVSALAPTFKADLSEGACFNDCRVEVEAA